MFIPVKNDTGAVQPLEYLAASVGEYKVGMLLKNDCELSPISDAETVNTTPPYLCMTDINIPEGEIAVIAVQRVNSSTIYEVANEDPVEPGKKCAVTGDGIVAETAGTFEIVENVDGAVRGRFV